MQIDPLDSGGVISYGLMIIYSTLKKRGRKIGLWISDDDVRGRQITMDHFLSEPSAEFLIFVNVRTCTRKLSINTSRCTKRIEQGGTVGKPT